MATTHTTAAGLVIGYMLRRLREDAGVTQTRAGSALGVRGKSVDTVKAIESGERKKLIPRDDLLTLLGLYEAPPGKKQLLLDLHAETKPKAPWTELSPSPAVSHIVGLELSARRISSYSNMSPPGWFQPRSMTEALIEALTPGADPETVKREVDLREFRRESLLGAKDDGQRPSILAILDESVLARLPQDRAVRQDWLELVQATAGLVDLRVLPFGASVHPALVPCGVIELGSELLPPVGYVDGVADTQILLEDDEKVGNLIAMFARLVDMALNPEESADFIAQHLERGNGR